MGSEYTRSKKPEASLLNLKLLFPSVPEICLWGFLSFKVLADFMGRIDELCDEREPH